MATQTTQMAFPPIDSQAAYTFIDAKLTAAQKTGTIADDFKLALATHLGLDNNAYSIDDLWKRFLVQAVPSDGNANANGPIKGGRGHKGQHPKHDYSEAVIRNAGNAFGYPGRSIAMDYISAFSNLADETYFDTDAGAWVTCTNSSANIPMLGRDDGDDYLISHFTLIANVNNYNIDTNGYRILGPDGTAMTGSTVFYESPSQITGTFSYGVGYAYTGWFTADSGGSDITPQHTCPGSAGDYVYANRSNTFCLNLTTDVPNHVKARTTTTKNFNSLTNVNTDCAVTLGAGDWVVFVGATVGMAGGGIPYTITSLTDSVSGENWDFGTQYQEGFTGEEDTHSTIIYLDNYAGGTLTISGRSVSTSIYGVYQYGCIVALPLSDFREAYGTANLGETPIASTVDLGIDEDILTLNIASMASSTTDGVCLGGFSTNYVGASQCEAPEIQEQIDAGGYTPVAWNNIYNQTRRTNTDSYTGYPICRNGAGSYNAGEAVDFKMVINRPEGTKANYLWKCASVVYLDLVQA